MSINEKLTHPCDFLYYCDNDIWGIYNENPDADFKSNISEKNFNSATNKRMSDIVKRIKDRDLPKRAFAINYSTVKMQDQKQYKVSDFADRLRKIFTLREEICDVSRKSSNNLPTELGGKQSIDVYDIHISIPNTSIAKDLSNALVVNNNNEFVSLSEIVRLSDWADAFAWHKWNAYVFSKAEVLPIVSIASKIVFERHDIKFDEETVFLSIKNSDKITEMIQWLKDNGKYPS
jgi:viroplasmin and RNaseH domain-containing protein